MNVFRWLTDRYSSRGKALSIYRRGMAKAKQQDHQGAIEDFGFYVEWLTENDRYEPSGPIREEWITKLEAGQNPIDETMLQALQ